MSTLFQQIEDQDLTLSFDVGIINLAYCLLSEERQIFDWGIIDLVTNEQTTQTTCVAEYKSGKNKGTKCTATASFFVAGNKTECYCSRHKKNSQNELLPIKSSLICETVLSSGPNKGHPCNKKAMYYHDKENGDRVGFCTVHSKGKLNLERYFTVDNISNTELKCKLFRALDKKESFKHAKTVLIEHQPPHATDKMRSVAYALEDYFIIRGMIDSNNHHVIKSIDAKNKLTIYDGPPISCHLKNQYSRNKWYAKKYCEWILRDRPLLLNYFKGFPKADDIADCFLQGVWYLNFGQHGKKGIISSAHQKLVYLEQNTEKFKKCRAVKPSAKQLSKQRLTLSNIKYFAKTHKTLEEIKKIKGLLSSIEFFFGDVDNLLKLLC